MLRHYLDSRVRRLVRKRPVAAVRVTFLSRHQEDNITKKKHARHRSCSNFHPPLKNVIFTVGVKSVSKMSFLRSMGSTKNVLLKEHGKHISEFRLRSQTTTFLHHLRRWVSKWQNVIPTLHEKQKNELLTEHRNQIFHLCKPLD